VLGADAILFDAFGYDFGVTRERQNDAVGYAHSLGMPVMANAWAPADAFGSTADPDHNPLGLATLLGAGDYYLSESYRIRLGEYQPEELWRIKADLLAAYRAELGFSVLSVTTNAPSDVYSEEKFFEAWEAAAAYGHLATGWGEYLFSADDGLAPYRARPAPTDPPPPAPGLPPDPVTLPSPAEEGDGGIDLPAMCRGEQATVVGTAGDDRLIGTDGPDIIAGLGGNDVIDGLGGDDLICGGGGDDVIRAGPGDDRLVGGPGSDDLWGDAGADVVQGGGAGDRLIGGPEDDVLKGNGGDDLLQGGEGNDRLAGGAGADVLLGGAGDDRLFGRRGDDFLQGDEGFDRARGGPQLDQCTAERAFKCES
jgi:hypothetical protein